mmetsp:Transcript_9835/g.15857  ORF Transcript_9835/g.15857 Transcript_9835/m.15857 type:complete len:224 (+) Transcript_9835:623-1294(+)
MFITRLIRSAIPGSEAAHISSLVAAVAVAPGPPSFLYSSNMTSASIFANKRRWLSTSSTYSSRKVKNSSSSMRRLAMISIELQMTPHLFAELSLTISTPLSVSLTLASCSMKMFAASTMSFEEGFFPSTRKFCQLFMRMVFGRPPAGKNASDSTLLCMESHIARPSAVLRVCRDPDEESLFSSKWERSRSLSTRRRSSSMLRPSGSSTHARWSTIPSTLVLSP